MAWHGGGHVLPSGVRNALRSNLDDVDRLVGWRPVDRLLKRGLKRRRDAAGNPAHPALAMFKVLLRGRCWNPGDRGTADALAERISFRPFAGLSFDYDAPDSTTTCRFRNRPLGLDRKLFELIGRQLEAHQLVVKQGVVVDATIVESARRPGVPKRP